MPGITAIWFAHWIKSLGAASHFSFETYRRWSWQPASGSQFPVPSLGSHLERPGRGVSERICWFQTVVTWRFWSERVKLTCKRTGGWTGHIDFTPLHIDCLESRHPVSESYGTDQFNFHSYRLYTMAQGLLRKGGCFCFSPCPFGALRAGSLGIRWSLEVHPETKNHQQAIDTVPTFTHMIDVENPCDIWTIWTIWTWSTF